MLGKLSSSLVHSDEGCCQVTNVGMDGTYLYVSHVVFTAAHRSSS